MQFHFSGNEPLRKERQTCLCNLPVTSNPGSLSFTGNTHVQGEKHCGGRTWGLVMALPLVCFRTLNKSFQGFGLQPSRCPGITAQSKVLGLQCSGHS